MRRHSGAWIASAARPCVERLCAPQAVHGGAEACTGDADAGGDETDADAAAASACCTGQTGQEGEAEEENDAAAGARQAEAAQAAASFLLSIARGGLTVRDAISAARSQELASARAAAVSVSPSLAAASPRESAGGTGDASGGGTGSTDASRNQSGVRAEARSQTPLEVLRVDSPTDTALGLLLDRMYGLEVVEPTTALLHDDESYAPDCAFCLDPMLPHEQLVRSTHGVCSRHHVFHAACFPLSWAQDKGCPMCREPVFALRPAAVDTPFSLHSTGSMA
jgi:hypothetical protein